MRPCNLFTGHVTKNGYGQKKYKGKLHYAHRIAYCEHNGVTMQDIAGKVVMHSCDVRHCTEPTHLSLGDQAHNLKDMCLRQRSHATFPDSTIREIRRLYSLGATQVDIGLRFGCSQTHVSDVVNHKARYHVKDTPCPSI